MKQGWKSRETKGGESKTGKLFGGGEGKSDGKHKWPRNRKGLKQSRQREKKKKKETEEYL